MSLYSQLFLRETNSPYGDVNRNSTLSFRDLDQNFLFLKERDINQLRVVGSDLIYETLGGDTYSVNIGGASTGTTDTFVTGFTFNTGTNILTIKQNEGQPDLTTDLTALSSDVYVLSGVYNPSTGIVTYTNSTGGTFQVSGFTTGMTDSYTDAATLNGNTIEFDNNIQGSNFYNVDLTPVISGFTTGNTLQEVLDNGSTAVGIATDVSINKTGGTHDTTWSLTDNDGGISQTDGTWTGANKVETSSLSYLQLTNGTITSQIAASKTEVKMDWTDAGGNNILAINSTSNTFTDGINSKGLEYASDYSSNFTNESLVTKRYVTGITSTLDNFYVTGFTYDDVNTFTLERNGGLGDLTATVSVLSGITYYGDGSNLSGISTDNFYVTGGTLTDGTLTLERNDNQSFDITGFTDGCQVIVTNVGSGNSQLYSLPLSANTGAFFDYVVSGSTGVRSGSLTTVFSGTSANIADLSTDDIGDTSDVSFNVTIAGGEANLNVSAVTGTWRIEFTPTKCDVTSTVSGGEINTGTNIGGGEGLFSAKSGVELQFKTLTSTGGTVTITSTGDTVNLESSGGGGGSGIVYIASGTTSDLLDDTNNWDINGEYTGTTITGTLQGYAHYNSDYWFTAVDDNNWIRLIRG